MSFHYSLDIGGTLAATLVFMALCALMVAIAWSNRKQTNTNYSFHRDLTGEKDIHANADSNVPRR